MTGKTCRVKIDPYVLGDMLCLPDLTQVRDCSIDTDGTLILHISGVEDDLAGKDAVLILTKQVDRSGRYIITSELKDANP